jgi:cation diffusion facilitator CzcD-associated flavoprotein CzcO
MSHLPPCPVAIIGTGPYGLSLAAHLEARGVGYRIFGKPMDLWRNHVPKGMMLKSDGFASNLSAPVPGATLKDYCSHRHIQYADRGFPIPVADFVDYADWFRGEFVSHHDERMVADVAKTADGYLLTLEDGAVVAAEQVVLAVGISWFPVLPKEFSALSSDLVSHSYDHRTVDRFAGKKVVVLGGGASAVNLAYELEQVGADTTLLVRKDHVEFHERRRGKRGSLLYRLKMASSPIGPGWKTWICANLPQTFYSLPEKIRYRALRNHLKPAAGWFMRDRVEKKVPFVMGRRIESVRHEQAGLTLGLSDGAQLTCNHVICATGYDVSVKRLPFLRPELAGAITGPSGNSAVGRDFQTKVPGLYAIGPMAMDNFGPLLRFMAGAEYCSPVLAKTLARRVAMRAWRRRLAAMVRLLSPAAKPAASPVAASWPK